MASAGTASKPRICIVTGSRADYGLLQWIIQELKGRTDCALQVLVTGMHIMPEFGDTWKEIAADGVAITRKVPIAIGGDDAKAMVKSVGHGTVALADAFGELAPDIVLLLGDRFEIFAAAQAAALTRIPVAHLHGGEITEGVLDDMIRHCITKLARDHLVSSAEAAARVRQLGEAPETIFVTGAPGLDNIRRLSLLSREDLARDLGVDLARPYFLVTHHAVTALGEAASMAQGQELLAALDRFADHSLIMTKGNADPAGRALNAALEAYAAAQGARVKLATSLGQLRYLSALKHCAAIVGNSSSGLTEAPLLGRPTVNIGERQKGRPEATSVISCAATSDAIADAIARALAPAFQASARQAISLYGDGYSSRKVVDILLAVAGRGTLPPKRFHDLPR